MTNKELREKALAKCISKWSDLAQGFRPISLECGFCWYVCKMTHHVEFSNEACALYCPLFPDICSNIQLSREQLYWQGAEKYITKAKKMLSIIKKRGAKWVSEVK